MNRPSPDAARPRGAGFRGPLLCLAALLVSMGVRTGSAQGPPSASTPGSGLRADTITLATPTGVLHGTLLLPATPAPRMPVALIHAGSGPTDRDGNSPLLAGANNSLRLLAEGLAAQGIASVRFDKRGIAGSRAAGGREEDLRFDTLIEDAAGWVRQLRADPRFSSVTVIGHSEGSLIGMVAAARAGANGFVSIAGSGRPAQDVIREQLRAQLPPAMLASAERGMAALAEGRLADSTPPELASLFRPSVQPYLISWFRYDPAKEIGALGVPILITQGTTDLQISATDAKLLASGAPRARLVMVEGMNHVLKTASGDRMAQMRSYGDPTLPVAPELVVAIAELIRSLR